MYARLAAISDFELGLDMRRIQPILHEYLHAVLV